ncbi:MAG: hypothetical protein RIE31_01675 [Alphaproteobacteria bacterium]
MATPRSFHAERLASVPLEEIIFEYQAIGQTVRVSATDPASLTEVTVIAPRTAGEATWRRIAEQKLRWVLARRRDHSLPVGL